MKQIKLLALGVSLVLLLGFTSCKDNKNEPDQNPDEAVAVNPTNVFTHGVPSQVGDLVITTNAAGLVTKIVDGDEVTTFDYTPSKSRANVNNPADYDMTMNVEWGNDDDGVDFFIKLNEQGFIEYVYEIDEAKYDGQSVEEWWFKYDDQGRMIEMKRTEGDNEITTITYNSDGDITNVLVSDDDAPRGKMKCEIAYTSDSQTSPLINKSGIMLYDASFRIDMDEMAPAFFAGLLGKATAHLPVSAVEESLTESGYKDVYTFVWQFNASLMPVGFFSSYKSYSPWIEGEPPTYQDDPVTFAW